MRLLSAIAEGWIRIALIGAAAVRMIFGMALLSLAGWLLIRLGLETTGNVQIFWLVLTGWVAYHGCRRLFGALAVMTFGSGASDDEPTDVRTALRRNGMLGRGR